MFDSDYVKQKIEKADKLRELGLNPYSNEVSKDTTIKEFKINSSYIKDLQDKRDESKVSSIVGRVKLLRLMGKAAFATIEDKDSLLQIYISRDVLGGDWFNNLKKILEVGDIINVCGFAFITKTGELSLYAKEFKIVTKSLSPLPEKFHGLTDKESRYRQRYLDMIMNADVREVFTKRSKIISSIRAFFENRDFLEVETPMLHPISGGASAKPFTTKHNTLDMQLYLRIAPELYLKRLLVGGMDAVFEINRCFRNEGMDLTHNPEFTTIEFYWAYKTYEDLITLTEELFTHIKNSLNLNDKIEYDTNIIDISTPFKRYTYKDALIQIGGISEDILDDKNKIVSFLEENEIEFNKNLDLGYLQAELFDNFVEDKLINPTFITHFPISISPLARRNDSDKNIADRFELFVGGKEIANAFSELNDPIDQYDRFKKQIDAKNSGDDEAQEMDEDYVRALTYGMPPAAGEGIGIDRLVMLFTNSISIRDVLLFPAMKPLKSVKDIDKD